MPGYIGPSPDSHDNLICTGQTIHVCPAHYFAASILIAGDLSEGSVTGEISLVYTDDTTSQTQLRTRNWYSFLTIDRGVLTQPYRFTKEGINWNNTQIFERTVPLRPGKKLKEILLPDKSNSTEGRLHVFAISLWKQESSVTVQSVRPTQKWVGNGTQLIEVTVNNAGTDCIAGQGFNVTISGDGFRTAAPGHIKRLCPGDQKTAAVEVEGESAGPVQVNVEVESQQSTQSFAFDDVEIGLKEWTSDLSSLALHESPDWFNDAKFGIFIHWGPYAVTGWGNSTPYESYAEWFWWYSLHHPEADKSDFYDYRLRTYGKDWAYDDTFPDYNASAWDPKEWVDLFADAGAQYFVITTKHHDGFCLFDSGHTTNRSALHYGPKRDLLQELFDAAETYQPSLKRGTYFSLPEWFNPDFGPYGFLQYADQPSGTSWTGFPAYNPYTGAIEPYTGRIPIGDFIEDLMVPQMETLAYKYQTDIMWCDAGAANGTVEFAAKWYNTARSQGRDVTMNSRCGISQADFDTPEYETFASAQRHKWESNQGMDPYSYGYNRATPSYEYMNASTVVGSLVDMVSKNGNLLLDIGPRADGSIVQEEIDSLREAGRWIKKHGEAVFNTTYWFVQTEVVDEEMGVDIRFTQTEEAFYIVFLKEPVVGADGWISVSAAVPVVARDEVSYLSGENSNEKLEWKVVMVDGGAGGQQPTLKIKAPEAWSVSNDLAWVFKVSYLG